MIAIRVIVSLLVVSLTAVMIDPVAAYSASLCLKSTLTDGKVRHRKQLVSDGSKCPRGYTKLLDAIDVSAVGLQGPPGPQGPQGLQGPQGATGAQGPAGLENIELFFSESSTDSVSPKFAAASCPNGFETVSGGGGVVEGLFDVLSVGPVALSYNGFSISPTPTWIVRAFETQAYASNWRVYAFIMCRPQ